MIPKLTLRHCNQEVVIDQLSLRGFTGGLGGGGHQLTISPLGDDLSFAGVQQWEFWLR